MIPASGGNPSIMKMGGLSISTVVNDDQTTIEAKQKIKLSDGKELIVTVQFANGTDTGTIEKEMNLAVVKMADVAILHGLGDLERQNPSSRLVLKSDNVLEKHYV